MFQSPGKFPVAIYSHRQDWHSTREPYKYRSHYNRNNKDILTARLLLYSLQRLSRDKLRRRVARRACLVARNGSVPYTGTGLFAKVQSYWGER
jgi:hypothetical protein